MAAEVDTRTHTHARMHARTHARTLAVAVGVRGRGAPCAVFGDAVKPAAGALRAARLEVQ